MNFKDLIKELDLKNASIEGDELRCSCPLASWEHAKGSDDSPSFGFKLEPNGAVIYHCLSCKAKGTLPKLLDILSIKTGDMKYQLLWSQVDKVEHVEKEPEYTYSSKLLLDNDLYEYIFEDVLDYKEAREYVQSRNIKLSTCERLNIKYDPEERRLIFFVYDYVNNLVGFQGRSIDPGNKVKTRNKAKMPIKHVFLGMHKFVHGKPIILVEGLFMYLRMHDLGFDKDYNIFCVLGSNISKEKREFLKGVGSPVYFLLDNDNAGNMGAFGTKDVKNLSNIFKGDGIKGATAELCKYINVYRVIYPEGIEDPDDLSKEQLVTMLKDAKLMRKVT